MLLSELTSADERVAVVGLAKNTGKTVALTALLLELQSSGRRVGVTSVGRDGEEHDVIDFRIEKPRVRLVRGSLLATTDVLLRGSDLPHEVLEETDMRTPLGRVLIARVEGDGEVEVAGPSVAQDVRSVSDAMLGHGAEQVLIDGAVDRRAASSPEVSDALVISTGAVLGEEVGEVVERTRDAVALVRLAPPEKGVDGAREGGRLAGQAALLAPDRDPVELEPRFVLTAGGAAIANLLDSFPSADRILVAGALPEAFLAGLATAARSRGRALEVIVPDSTKVFLSERGPDWYRLHGIALRALRPIELRALTVNPVAPRSHAFDSAEIVGALRDAIDGVPVFDVLHPEYAGGVPGAMRL